MAARSDVHRIILLTWLVLSFAACRAPDPVDNRPAEAAVKKTESAPVEAAKPVAELNLVQQMDVEADRIRAIGKAYLAAYPPNDADSQEVKDTKKLVEGLTKLENDELYVLLDTEQVINFRIALEDAQAAAETDTDVGTDTDLEADAAPPGAGLALVDDGNVDVDYGGVVNDAGDALASVPSSPWFLPLMGAIGLVGAVAAIGVGIQQGKFAYKAGRRGARESSSSSTPQRKLTVVGGGGGDPPQLQRTSAGASAPSQDVPKPAKAPLKEKFSLKKAIKGTTPAKISRITGLIGVLLGLTTLGLVGAMLGEPSSQQPGSSVLFATGGMVAVTGIAAAVVGATRLYAFRKATGSLGDVFHAKNPVKTPVEIRYRNAKRVGRFSVGIGVLTTLAGGALMGYAGAGLAEEQISPEAKLSQALEGPITKLLDLHDQFAYPQ